MTRNESLTAYSKHWCGNRRDQTVAEFWQKHFFFSHSGVCNLKVKWNEKTHKQNAIKYILWQTYLHEFDSKTVRHRIKNIARSSSIWIIWNDCVDQCTIYSLFNFVALNFLVAARFLVLLLILKSQIELRLAHFELFFNSITQNSVLFQHIIYAQTPLCFLIISMSFPLFIQRIDQFSISDVIHARIENVFTHKMLLVDLN